MKITDQFEGQKFAPINGIHHVVNEKQQIMHHQWIFTTKNDERRSIIKNITQRLRDRNFDPSQIVLYLDKCCEEDWYSALDGIRVLLDNHHLITRYRDHSNASDRAKYNLFMSKVAQIIVGSGRSKMRAGK